MNKDYRDKGIWRLVLTTICLCHIAVMLRAQPLHTRIYGPDDGLPDLECTGAFDMDGHLHIVSQSAISKRIGNRWTYIPSDSTGHNYSTRMATAFDNGYYVLNMGYEGLIIHKDGEWTSVPAPECCENTPALVNQSYYCFCNNGRIFKLDIENAKFDFVDTSYHSILDNHTIIAWSPTLDSSYVQYSLLSEDGVKLRLIRNVETSQVLDSEENVLFPYVNSKLIYKKHANELFLDGKLQGHILTNEDITFENLKWEVFDVKQVADSVYHIFGRRDGIWYLNVLDPTGLSPKGEVPHSIPSISYYFNAKANAALFASHLGLIRVDYNRLWFDTDNSSIVDAIHSISEDNQGTIWFGGYGGGIASYSNGMLQKNNEVPFKRYLPGAHKHVDGRIYTFLEAYPKMAHSYDGVWTPQKLIREDKEQDLHSGYLVRSLRDGRMVLGLQKEGLGIVDSIKDKSIFYHTIGSDQGMTIPNILGIAEDSNNRIWLGGRGVAVYDSRRDTAYTFPRSESNELSFSCISMAYDHLDNLWLGTPKGLYVLHNASSFDPRNDDFHTRVEPVPLPNGERSLITSVMITSDSIVIAGCQESINLIPLIRYDDTEDTPFIYQLYYGDDISGDGTEQNCIMEDSKGYVWIGTQTGALRIDPKSEIWDTATNQIVILSQKTGKGELELVENKITLPSDSRNLTLEYGPDQDAFLRNSTFYDRFLLNEKGDTLQALQFDQKGILDLNYLEPGDYKLHIIAKKHNQTIDQRNITIYVPQTLTESAWFWAGLAFLISGIIGGFLAFRERQKQLFLKQSLQLARLENEKDKQQIQAIISSFNPHFINNSLHWAQSRYNRDEPFVRVIGRLSANIRHLFTYTAKGKSFHTIKEEFDIVSNYLAIQEERFKDEGYEYNLPSPDDIKQVESHPVFLMQLQILVENAIEHGIRHREKGGYVQVQIFNQAEDLKVIVTDNGIGRMAAEQIGSTGTQQGLYMLKTLHQIYNQKNDIPITMTYEDLPLIEENQSIGTRVTVILPKKYNYEFGED